MSPTRFLLTFINSSVEELHALETERNNLIKALQPLEKAGVIQLQVHAQASLDSIVSALSNTRDNLSVFHFAGHTDEEGMFTDQGTLLIEGLATLLVLQKDIKLVFLNGCATHRLLKYFFNKGIPLVLGTTHKIGDQIASTFATKFYQALAARNTISQAFQIALGAIKLYDHAYTSYSPQPEAYVVRGLELESIPHNDFPWKLYLDQNANNDVLDWALDYAHTLTSIPKLNSEEFLGRENLLRDIHQQLTTNPKGLQLNGVGGIGKTTLAKAYCADYGTTYGSVAWINCEGDVLNALTSKHELFQKLELFFGEDEPVDARFERLLNKMNTSRGRNLLILDNIDLGIANDKHFTRLLDLPSWTVLLTSRAALPRIKAVEIPPLEQDDALELFRLHYASESDADILTLINEIGGHTLFIEIFAKNLKRQHGVINSRQLLEKLKSFRLNDADLAEKIHTNHSLAEQLMIQYLIGLFNFSQLNPTQLQLCKQFAVLPSISITIETLAGLFNNHSITELNLLLNELADQGWLTHVEDEFFMHRIVQEAIKYVYQPGELDYNNLTTVLAQKLKKRIGGHPIIDNFVWVPYAASLSTYLCLISAEVWSPSLSSLNRNLAYLYSDLGQFDTAQKLIEAALKSDEIHFEADPRRVPNTLCMAAEIYSNSEKKDKAIDYYERAWDLQQKRLDPEDADFIRTLHGLGVVYLEMGNIEPARSLLGRVFDWDRKNTSSADLNRAIGLQNLACCFIEAAKLNIRRVNLGDLKTAIELLNRALAIQQQHFALDHPDIIKTKIYLGIAFLYLRDFNKLDGLTQEMALFQTHDSWYMRKLLLKYLWLQAERYVAEKKYERAEHFYHQALETIDESIPEKFLEIIELKKSYTDFLEKQKLSEKNWLSRFFS